MQVKFYHSIGTEWIQVVDIFMDFIHYIGKWITFTCTVKMTFTVVSGIDLDEREIMVTNSKLP